MISRISAVFLATAAVGTSALGQIQFLSFQTESRAYTGVKGVGNKDEAWAEDTFSEALVDFTGPDNSSNSFVLSDAFGQTAIDDIGTLHVAFVEFSSPAVSGQQATGFAQTNLLFQADGVYDVGGFGGFDFSQRAPFQFDFGYEVWNVETQTIVLQDAIAYSRPLASVTAPFEITFDFQSYDFDGDATYLLRSTMTFAADRGVLAYGLAQVGDYGFEPVPEPATLAVLGLGALVLRRRRAR
jgi:hypothetical protein